MNLQIDIDNRKAADLMRMKSCPVPPPWWPEQYVKSEQAVQEYKKRSGYAIGANTRFSPTKDFGMKVGVSLVFTRNSRTA